MRLSNRSGVSTPVADVLTPEQRRYNMSRIRSSGTEPELAVRRRVHRLGFRYRLNRSDLPGKPDLVFPSSRRVIFVHGCYWHMHACRYGRVTPKTNAAFWKAKRTGTVRRDRRVLKELATAGWSALVVWACELAQPAALERRIVKFLKAK